MPIGKEFKKFGKKFPKEFGRVVRQAGEAIQGATDSHSIIELGKTIENQGNKIFTKAQNKLADPVLTSSQSSGPSSSGTSGSPPAINEALTEQTLAEDEQADIISLASSETTEAAILTQKNLELTKRIKELEAQLKVQSEAQTREEQKDSSLSCATPKLHLRFNLKP